MKNKFFWAPLLLVTMAAGLLAAEAPVQEPSATERTPDPSQAAKPPRVVGRPQSQEEASGWMAIEQAVAMEEKTRLALEFLEKYPTSGLTPFVHQLLAFAYQQANDYDKFVLHGEKTLEELPQNPLILSSLGVAYAQRGHADKALERAGRAVTLMESLQRPIDVPEVEWIIQKDQLEADAHYAMGVAYITLFAKSPAGQKADDDPNLNKAKAELDRAVELDPLHDRAYYQLGFVSAKFNRGQQAIENYARAAALGGAAQGPAREQLKKVYEVVNRTAEGLEQVIVFQKDYVQQKMKARRDRLEAEYPPAPPQPSPQPPQP
jgi:tetratricopeptide (TPR) repeat protein